MTIIPIKLEGDNLGEKHQCLNKAVNNVYTQHIPFNKISELEEASPVDRLFKIDLASKYKNVDYIVQCLCDEDMLYVSRALKCNWLVKNPQYSNIINPKYLEEVLFPRMLTTAVTKMKNKIYIHLHDEARCQQFHEYYKDGNVKYALKFLPKCSEDYIVKEMEDISERINPHYLKLLTEKTPKAAELYFTKMLHKRPLAYFRGSETKYLNEVMFLLKTNPEIFFNIIENFFYDRNRLSAEATKHILNNHKEKYSAKPELYVSRILNIDVLARYLDSDEIKELIIKLARAKYIESWFSYKNTESLLKRIDKKEKKAFVKRIFSEKDFGEVIETPPYKMPAAPPRVDDEQFSTKTSSVMEFELPDCVEMFMCRDEPYTMMASKCMSMPKRRTLLDELFDTYRFEGFSKTFFELKNRLQVESSHADRLMIMYVLVSKSGGKEEQVRELLEFLVQRHYNEPSTVRASVVRSLVRRARVYRLPDCWGLVVAFARDVKPGDCTEYTHGDVIRHALLQIPAPEILVKSFLESFDTMTQYELTATEKKAVHRYIIDILIEKANLYLQEKKPSEVNNILDNILCILDVSKAKVQDNATVLSIIKSFVALDVEGSKRIVAELYRRRICRKLFFLENFNFRQNEASYLNALRHNAKFLNETEKFQKLVHTLNANEFAKQYLEMDRFLMKISIYFRDELAKRYLTILEERVNSEINYKKSVGLGRSICILKGPDTLSFMNEKESQGDSGRRLAAALGANLHLIRPKLNTNLLNWEKLGALAAHNFLITGSPNSIEQRLNYLAPLKKKAFTRLRLILSFRSLPPGRLAQELSKINAKQIPLTLTPALGYIMRQQKLHPLVWEQIKALLRNGDVKNTIVDTLVHRLQFVPANFKYEYCTIVYRLVKKSGLHYSSSIKFESLNIILAFIKDNLTKFTDDFVDEIGEDFLQFADGTAPLHTFDYHFRQREIVYVQILGKSLLLCKTVDQQNKRIEKLVQPQLGIINKFFKNKDIYKINMHYVKDNFNIFLRNVKNTKLFMDSNYVSPMPVFEKIAEWMKQFLPMERYFKYYVPIHLTMIYYKTVQQCIKQWPDILEDRYIQNKLNVEKIGVVFGRYIGHESNVLISNYFPSIISLYVDELLTYINSYFSYGRSSRKVDVEKFKKSILKGLFEDKNNDNAILLGVLMYKKLRYNDEDFKITNDINNKEIQFFVKTDPQYI